MCNIISNLYNIPCIPRKSKSHLHLCGFNYGALRSHQNHLWTQLRSETIFYGAFMFVAQQVPLIFIMEKRRANLLSCSMEDRKSYGFFHNMMVSKWWQNCHLCANYPFKVFALWVEHATIDMCMFIYPRTTRKQFVPGCHMGWCVGCSSLRREANLWGSSCQNPMHSLTAARSVPRLSVRKPWYGPLDRPTKTSSTNTLSNLSETALHL